MNILHNGDNLLKHAYNFQLIYYYSVQAVDGFFSFQYGIKINYKLVLDRPFTQQRSNFHTRLQWIKNSGYLKGRKSLSNLVVVFGKWPTER